MHFYLLLFTITINYCGRAVKEQRAINSRLPIRLFHSKKMACCLEIFFSCISNRLIQVVIVLKLFCNFKCLIFKKASEFITGASQKTEMEQINWSKKVGSAWLLQAIHFGDVPNGVKTRLQQKNEKKLQILCTINTLNKKTLKDG